MIRLSQSVAVAVCVTAAGGGLLAAVGLSWWNSREIWSPERGRVREGCERWMPLGMEYAPCGEDDAFRQDYLDSAADHASGGLIGVILTGYGTLALIAAAGVCASARLRRAAVACFGAGLIAAVAFTLLLRGTLLTHQMPGPAGSVRTWQLGMGLPVCAIACAVGGIAGIVWRPVRPRPPA